ncbi:MAG: RNA methyltransferase, partial [Aeromicrobium sp.]
YQHIRHHETAEDLVAWAQAQGLTVVAVDNVPGSVPIETATIPKNCIMVFGQEGPGLSPQMQAACEFTVSIAQFGSTRSINAGAAAAIAMHSWIRQYADIS